MNIQTAYSRETSAFPVSPGTWAIAARTCLFMVVALVLLTACGGEQAATPQPSDNSQAATTVQSTATTGGSSGESGTGSAGAGDSANLPGIDLSKADPCTLLTREEAEAIMGPLEWMPKPHVTNDPTYRVSCNFDQPLVGDTPEKSLTVDVYARDTWIEDFNDLQQGDAARIPSQELLGGIAPVGFDNSYAWTQPEICEATLPCIVAKTGDQWLTLTILMSDRSALHLELNPRNVDLAKQLARKILDRLPMK